MKIVECEVCGTHVYPKREYTTKSTSLFSVETYWDVMDCSLCGCQILLKVRALGVQETIAKPDEDGDIIESPTEEVAVHE